MPWRGGVEHRVEMLRYQHMATYISIVRDRDEGRVLRAKDSNRPTVEYTPSDFDRAHGVEGVIAMAKICYVTGATEIRPLFPGVDSFKVTRRAADGPTEDEALKDETSAADPETHDAGFATFIRNVRSAGNRPPEGMWTSAHQMGTCRMSGRGADDGVVDGDGRVYGVAGLFVADCSCFPSASGVNPMVTAMAIADWVSGRVGEELGAAMA